MPLNSSREQRLRQLRDNHVTRRQKTATVTVVPRKLCLVWEDGTRMRFPYHFLLAEKHTLGDDEHLTLQFMSDTVTLKGIHLAALVDYLGTEPPYIYITPSRYTPLEKQQPYVVTEVVVESK